MEAFRTVEAFFILFQCPTDHHCCCAAGSTPAKGQCRTNATKVNINDNFIVTPERVRFLIANTDVAGANFQEVFCGLSRTFNGCQATLAGAFELAFEISPMSMIFLQSRDRIQQ